MAVDSAVESAPAAKLLATVDTTGTTIAAEPGQVEVPIRTPNSSRSMSCHLPQVPGIIRAEPNKNPGGPGARVTLLGHHGLDRLRILKNRPTFPWVVLNTLRAMPLCSQIAG